MIVVEVKTSKQAQEFLEVPKILYRSDKNWVCPLDQDIEAIFDAKKNNFHQHGEVTRWILKNKSGNLIGRVAAFINHEKAHSFDIPTGGIGFFEVINNYEAAKTLFDSCKNWLSARGMKAMQGPINFGENDTFWGLLAEGFTRPSYGMNYNFPFYKEIFEQYGFICAYEQISNMIDIAKPFPERFTKIANWVSQKEGYEFKHFEKKNLERYAKDLLDIYNDAWRDFDNFVPMQLETVLTSFHKMKLIVDEKLIWFAYVDGIPAAFVVIIPDINPLIKNLNGKLNLWEKIRFLYYKHFSGTDRIRAIVMGTKKKYQKHGLESALFIQLKSYILSLNNRYKELELSWVGDFNDPMLAIHQATGATFSKKHITYIKKFDTASN